MPFGVGPGVGVGVGLGVAVGTGVAVGEGLGDGDGDGDSGLDETRVATMPRNGDPNPTTVTSSPTGSAGGLFVDEATTTIVADELPVRSSEKPRSLDPAICPVTVSSGGRECQTAM